ncbi:hypothetical protein D9615_004853 [Tricholomella constricta]|uniref:CCHC-type domain-containing protein n=1 Tax=Tricholomella constricta TaxID=117010 RepID=A0A8H5HGT0_9AGAR|nr:hypothetical protein D9615_004855 [Tricholomella constricta]KAF5383101.1 hypothetical protein D9615_004853 [Tricholomella constricta]
MPHSPYPNIFPHLSGSTLEEGVMSRTSLTTTPKVTPTTLSHARPPYIYDTTFFSDTLPRYYHLLRPVPVLVLVSISLSQIYLASHLYHLSSFDRISSGELLRQRSRPPNILSKAVFLDERQACPLRWFQSTSVTDVLRRVLTAPPNRQLEHPQLHSSPTPNPSPAADVICYKCGKKGHYSRECKQKPYPVRAQIRAARTAVDEEDDDSDMDQEVEADDESGHTSANEADNPPESSVDSDSDELIEVDVYDNDYYSRDSETEVLRAITELPLDETRQVKMRKVHLRASKVAKARPVHKRDDKECLATYVNVGGHDAWTLWDSGSTTTGVTPAFSQVAGLRVYPLEAPITLQLGTIGSCSTVNFGSDALVKTRGSEEMLYVDIANFDRYDMIIGTPFMRKHGVILDFATNTVVVNGVSTEATKVDLRDTDGRLCRYRTTDKPRD